ncbi:hypothetical protein [Maridesulfovibrio ferrireducens]|uniref:hypothetical protein n=1 Tax=Maridesulfovibrio ferrireducens TaxID=246191 RepID=UPI001A23810A|nr:hypothetical protein [Maridesulfovibrio ferrireducens]MBI9110297.1 hypothetical protein [Maridesulfovibrio ferrireducens]
MGNRPQYQLGVDCAVVLNWRTPEASFVKGLNRLGLPEMSRDAISVEEFRRDFSIEFTTGGKFGRVTFSGNTIFGDSTGQDLLKQYLVDNARITNAVVMLDKINFMALDLARDPEGCFQVSKASPGEADKNGVFSFSGEMVCGGRVAYFTKHMVADTIAFVAGSTGVNDTVTDSGSGFVTAGFAAGQTLIVDGSASNNGYYIIKEVAAGILTLESEGLLTTADAGVLTSLDGGKL